MLLYIFKYIYLVVIAFLITSPIRMLIKCKWYWFLPLLSQPAQSLITYFLGSLLSVICSEIDISRKNGDI